MPAIRNIFACLVHESPECVIDLVRNLRYCDPASPILLYNGSQHPALLESSFPFARYGAVVHPQPRPMVWGRLHDFALDCMRFALEHFSFDTLTIVDSDQLAVGSGYSLYLAQHLDGLRNLGMLGSTPERQTPTTQVAPAREAFKEFALWRPFLRQFPGGEKQFVHWTFWPSTVFTAEAARELTRLFESHAQLQEIMRQTKIWATEEVILPTLVALLGFKIAANPCRYTYVKYRVPYTLAQTATALLRRDVYWMHPVPRRYEHSVRHYIREQCNHYRRPFCPLATAVTTAPSPPPALCLTGPIVAQMKRIEGWLEEDEAHLLIDVAVHVLTGLPGPPPAVVEVGSYCGRATVVLGSVVRAVRPETKVYAIDAHDGRVGALDQGIRAGAPTLETFRRNMASANLEAVVEVLQTCSYEAAWDKPIGLLLIDGLHDYAHVARDFFHFEAWVVPGGYVAFHDYADYFPGVKVFVNELLEAGGYEHVSCERSMMVLRKQPVVTSGDEALLHAPWDLLSAAAARAGSRPDPAPTLGLVTHTRTPLVSCIMPTANRRQFVPQAVQYFLRQDYPNCELVVVDDGADPIADVLPSSARIRYIRLVRRQTVGSKRNLACQASQGEIIVHWDDDDWMASWRLSYQVEHLLREAADICGLDRPLLYHPGTWRAWQYVHPRHARAWVYGATLCYTKALWEKSPFANINVGEDTRFVWARRSQKLVRLPDCTFHVGVIHRYNVSPKRPLDARWRPYPSADVRQIMGDDWSFYTTIV